MRPPLVVVARDDRSIQFAWRAGVLPEGDHQVTVGPRSVALLVEAGRGGVVTVDGLEPARRYPVDLDGSPLPPATTLSRPPGAEGAKVATVSDCHVGERRFGALRLMGEPVGRRPYAERCLAAALAEIRAWGPDLVVIKGDLVDHGTEVEYRTAARVVAEADLQAPVIHIHGNHELKRGQVDRRPLLERAAIECAGLAVVDLPALRVVTADTAEVDVHGPHFPSDRLAALVEALSTSPGGALVCVHHQFHAPVGSPLLLSWPPGFRGRSALQVLDALAAAHPATLVTSGHTHCNRWARRGPLVMTQVGSTKDGLGVWGAYRAFEGGIIQSVRRIEDPDCVEWIDRTNRAVGTLWGRWSPGTLDQRCFTHHWPSAP